MESLPNPTNQPPVLQVVLRKPYSEIMAISEWLKDNTLNYLIGEHPAATSNGIHCHILIEGLKVTREALRKQVNKYSPGQGQNFTSALTKDTRQPYNREILATYILKGHIEYLKSTSFNQEYITERISRWVYKTMSIVTVIPPPEKKKAATIYEDCDFIIDNYLDAKFPVNTPSERTRVVAAIITWANEKRKAMNAYKVADYYDCIMMKAIPEYYSTLVVDIINNRHKKS